MQAVISAEQARKITGGRTPLVPVEYETACRALAECETIDSAKYWDNAADALAAWARIYHKDEAGIAAKRLKLRAHDHMGRLAGEIRRAKTDGKAGRAHGAVKLLMEHGFSKNAAQTMRSLARMPRDQFEAEVRSPSPRAPSKFVHQSGYTNPTWQAIYHRLQGARSECGKHSAKEIAGTLTGKEAENARRLCSELAGWLDEFESALK